MLTKIVNEIIKKDLKNIAILTHRYPDYDALCSANALAEIIYREVIKYKYPHLKQLSLDEQNKIISPFVYPIFEKTNIGNYKLSSSTKITEKDKLSNLLKQVSFDTAIVCDTNEQDRVFGGEILNNLDNNNIYLFDHHIGNRKELDILPENRLVKKASSTCEIILQDALKESIIISNRAMKDLYAGIVTDTCNFLFGVNDFTLKIKNNDIYGLNQQEKEKIDNIFNKLYKEDKDNLNNLQKNFLCFPWGNIHYLYKPKISKERGTYITSALEENIMPEDNKISVLFAIFDGYTEIKFRKGKNSNIMISELAKAFNGGGNEDRAATRVQEKPLIELINDLYKNINNQKYNSSAKVLKKIKQI